MSPKKFVRKYILEILSEPAVKFRIYLRTFTRIHVFNNIKQLNLKSKTIKTNKSLEQTSNTIHKKSQNDYNENDGKGSKERKLYPVLLFGFSVVFVGTYLIIKLGNPERDKNGHPVKDEFSQLPRTRQYIYRALNELHFYYRLVRKPVQNKLLPDRLSFPYQQPKYTLVIELVDVLIHPKWTYSVGWEFTIRPGLQFLLDTLSEYYEIVIFIKEPGINALSVVDEIDPKNLIAYKLVKDRSIFSGGVNIEDLDDLNRDLSKVILVDWDSGTAASHTDNLLNVKRWDGNENDKSLVDLALLLKTIAQSDVEDVREIVKHYSKYTDPVLAFRNNQKTYIDHLESTSLSEPTDKEKTRKKFWLPAFLRRKS